MGAELRLREDALAWRQVGGEIVALDLRSSEYLSVNPTGAVLWPVLAEGTTRAALAERLAAAFGIELAAAVRDVEAFLAELARHDLLEPGAR